MNYIKQLNGAFEKFYDDDRLNPTHISLDMALFQEWNSSRFANDFFVNRRDLMRVAKIGSKSTYHRCITDLDSWGYLCYYPSYNPYKGSKIKMSIIGTSDEPPTDHYDPKLEQLAERYHPTTVPEVYQHHPINGQVVNTHRPASGQALVPIINKSKPLKHNKQPKGLEEVLIFFKERNFNPDYGKKFFEYYQNREWLTNDGGEVRDWRALATSWMEKMKIAGIKKSTNHNGESRPSTYWNRDNLKTTKNKDYGQPL